MRRKSRLLRVDQLASCSFWRQFAWGYSHQFGFDEQERWYTILSFRRHSFV